MIKRDLMTCDRGWKTFDFWLFKLISLPGQGTMLQKKNYKGIKFGFYFWLPIESK